MKPTFELHGVFIMEKMEINLMQMKLNADFEENFYVELRNFFVNYLKECETTLHIHGDIKPRVALKKLVL